MPKPAGEAAPGPSARGQLGLDGLNFFVADVQTAFGPFIAVQLVVHGWSQGAIGSVLTINAAIRIVSLTPAGILVDHMHAKRALVAACLAATTCGALIFAFLPSYGPVALAQALHGSAGGALQAALAAIGPGLVGRRQYHRRVGRNERYNTPGNAATAMAVGALGRLVSPAAPFIAAAALCVPAAAALLAIRGRDIDYQRARGAERRRQPQAARFRVLRREPRLRTPALCLLLFQFADASMLPPVSERPAAHHRAQSVLIAAALVAIPQLATALIAGWLACHAQGPR